MPRPKTGITVDAHVPGEGWQARATCRGLDPDIFFPTDAEGTDEAKRICAGCPVRAQCLEYAVTAHEKFGVWGGTSDHERRRITRARAA